MDWAVLALDQSLQWAVILLGVLTDFCEQTGSLQEQRINIATNNSSGMRGGMSAASTGQQRQQRPEPQHDLKISSQPIIKVKTGKS